MAIHCTARGYVYNSAPTGDTATFQYLVTGITDTEPEVAAAQAISSIPYDKTSTFTNNQNMFVQNIRATCAVGSNGTQDTQDYLVTVDFAEQAPNNANVTTWGGSVSLMTQRLSYGVDGKRVSTKHTTTVDAGDGTTYDVNIEQLAVFERQIPLRTITATQLYANATFASIQKNLSYAGYCNEDKFLEYEKGQLLCNSAIPTKQSTGYSIDYTFLVAPRDIPNRPDFTTDSGLPASWAELTVYYQLGDGSIPLDLVRGEGYKQVQVYGYKPYADLRLTPDE